MRATRTSLVLLVIAASLLPASQHNRAFGQSKEEIAAKARDIFQANCLECHGGKKTFGGVKILDRELLVSKDKIAPGSADDSLLFQLITAKDETAMPPAGKTRLNADQVAVIKAWIAAGAPAFPSGNVTGPKERGFGRESILGAILQDVRRLSVADRKFARYFSIAHLMNAGASRDELEIQRDALAKAINHLSWQPELVRLVPIETTRTVFRIDLRKLGWDKQPFRQVKSGKFVANSNLNLYDLALLEYPYGVVSHTSANYLTLVQEFLNHANQVRPVPYVQADWFVSTATLSPLYEDFLQLPRTLKELETLLGVDSTANIANNKAFRAGIEHSGVSRNNRVVERHDAKYGHYWKSYDFQSSLGTDSIMTDPINLRPSGGEMIFNLPNGLQGYFVTDSKGNRIELAPTSIVVDENASDKVVRNGLSCMRCHERGVKTFADVVRPTFQKVGNAAAAGMNVDAVLKLYPEQSKFDVLVKRDEEKFVAAMEKLLGKPQTAEPLKPVSHNFLDVHLKLLDAASELGMAESKRISGDNQSVQLLKLGLASILVGESVPRDAWQANYERVVRKLRLAVPLVPLDGLTVPEYSPDAKAPFDVEIKTNQTGNIFKANEEIVIFVKPSKDVFIEVISTTARGRKVVLAPATTKVKAGAQFRFPAEGKTLKVKAGAGKEQITVFASLLPFKDGELLRGDNVDDRVVHRFGVRSSGQQIEMEYSPNPFQVVKKTMTFEAR
jgi:mono/diheme cytochrome c family protein